MILVIMYVETFKIEIIGFIGNAMICLMSHCLIIFSILVSPLILKISLGKIKKNVDNVCPGDRFTNGRMS